MGFGQGADLIQLLEGLIVVQVALIQIDLHLGAGQFGAVAADGQVISAGEAHVHVAVAYAAAHVQAVAAVLARDEGVGAEAQGNGDRVTVGDGDGLTHLEEGAAVGAIGAPGLPVLQFIAGVAVGVILGVLLTGLAAEGPGQALCPLLNVAAHLRSGNGQGSDKFLIAQGQTDNITGHGQLSLFRRGGGQDQHGDQHRRGHQQRQPPDEAFLISFHFFSSR